MNTLTPEDFGFTFLEDGETAQDFLDKKISELTLLDSYDAFYVADLEEILNKHLKWVHLMPRVTPFYAVKCNSSPPIVKMLAALGAGFDCASESEIRLVQSFGVDPSRIIYANTCKQMRHLKYAIAHGVDTMTFDSEAELVKIAHCCKKAKLVLRIIVDVSESLYKMNGKFGVTLEACSWLLQRARELGLDIIGVSFHVGSSCTNPDSYRKAIADVNRVFGMAAKLGYNMTLVDLGGGYTGYDVPNVFVLKEFAVAINAALDKYFPTDSGVRVIAEPGRYYVTTAYRLATNIIGKKIKEYLANENDGAKDKTIMYYVNDSIYTSFRLTFSQGYVMPSPHKKRSGECTYLSVIYGHTCDPNDVLVESCELPELQLGEWMLFYCMGAYSVTTSTTFNGFPKPDIHYVMSRSAWQRFLQISAQGLGPLVEACPNGTSVDSSYPKLVLTRTLCEFYAQQTAQKMSAARACEQLHVYKE